MLDFLISCYKFFLVVFDSVSSFFEFISVPVVLIIIFLGSTYYICNQLLKSERTETVKILSQRVHTGYGNLIFISISIVWASAVSVFGGDLKKQWFEELPVGWESVFFSLTVCFAIIIGVLHYIGQQRKEKEEKAKPPKDAVKCASQSIIQLSGMLCACQMDWQTLLSKAKSVTLEEIHNAEDNLETAKKACLKAMLEVVKNWEQSNDRIIYKANLFNLAVSEDVIRSFENTLSADNVQHHGTYSFNIGAVTESPFFLFNDNWRAKLERCDYVMVNEQNLSVSVPELPIDTTTHKPICMPYSQDGENFSGEIKQPNLHGAPMALQEKTVVYLASLKKNVNDRLEELSNSLCYKNHINQRFKDEIVSYYEGDDAGSIISIPLHFYEMGAPFYEKGSVDKPYKNQSKNTCILNIYTNVSYILENQRVAESYYDLTKPICYITAILVSYRVMLAQYKNVVFPELIYPLQNGHVKSYLSMNALHDQHVKLYLSVNALHNQHVKLYLFKNTLHDQHVKLSIFVDSLRMMICSRVRSFTKGASS